MSHVIVPRLDCWFEEKLGNSSFTKETVSYVVGVLSKRRWDDGDMSKESVVLTYATALELGDFASFQKIGDWSLFVSSVHPRHIDGVEDVVESIGRGSYHACHRLLRYEWKVYEELASELPSITRYVRTIIKGEMNGVTVV